jgi:hypothetical protein
MDAFLKLCANSIFRHRERLLAELDSGQTIFRTHTANEATSLTCSQYLAIYRRRGEHISELATAHAFSLREDVLALCKELEKPPDEPVRIWSFSKPPYYDYDVFEGAETRRILGCILGVDDRLIDNQTRETLWGKTDKRQPEK